jgi:hypothetical protein
MTATPSVDTTPASRQLYARSRLKDPSTEPSLDRRFATAGFVVKERIR